MKNIIIKLLFLVAIIAIFSTAVMADELQFDYTSYESGVISTKSFLMTGFNMELEKDYRLDSSIGVSGIIGGDTRGLKGGVNLYKKLNLDTGFDYYIGGGYDYLYNQKSTLFSGGKLSQNSLFINLMGANVQDQYSVISKVSYSPIGAYKYMDNRLRLMTTWKLGLDVNYRLTPNMHLLLGGEMGKEDGEEFNSDITKYKIGLSLDL